MITTPERINIRGLLMEEPASKREQGFDPTSIMTEANWDAGLISLDLACNAYDESRQRIDTLSTIRKAEFFAESAFSMSIVRPDRHFCNDKEEKILWYVAGVPGATQLYSYHFFPGRPKTLTTDEASEYLGDIDFTNQKVVGLAAAYKILYPEVPLSSANMQALKEHANSQIREHTRELTKLASIVAQYKLASGNIADLDIDHNRFWKMAKVTLENHFDFNLAANLKILYAQKIEFTDSGIELTIPEIRFSADAHRVLPNRRRF